MLPATPVPGARRCVAALALLVSLAACATAPAAGPAASPQASATGASPTLPGAAISDTDLLQAVDYPGIQHLHFTYGPIDIHPGQNTINFALNKQKPKVPGFITRFKPSLIYSADGTTPRVDVIHLHHGVWLMNGQPTFAAGEEKTILDFPEGYGLHFDPSDRWDMNYMIHNLTPAPTTVSITYDIDFVPDSAPAAASMTPVKPLWMDVAGIRAYPVFDALKGSGVNGRYTFPDMAKGAERAKIGPAHQFTADHDMTIITAGGHLHPGGLYDDLKDTRGGVTKEIFRSEAKYWEPAGAVSWDVATTSSKPDWKIALHPGDTLDVSSTYDVSRASWYESMGIMVEFVADGIQPGAKDPFTEAVDWHGVLTHGHLPENRHHGGDAVGLPDPVAMLSGREASDVSIKDFQYSRGDLTLNGPDGRPPVVVAGHSLTFTNLDSLPGEDDQDAVMHTITACAAPCNKGSGIAYPLANAAPSRTFDSGDLGYGPPGLTAAANRNTWKTSKSLKPGTYTYFCRIHPFMRGSFRVVAARSAARRHVRRG